MAFGEERHQMRVVTAGGHFGGTLARVGVELTLLARLAHLDALRAHGLTVRSAVGRRR
jgi:ketopantoate reductase